MKLSTKGRYSVTALYELALHYGEGVVPLKTIAQTQLISETYLEQLMVPLRRAGLVESAGRRVATRSRFRPRRSPLGVSLRRWRDQLPSWTVC